MFVLRNTFKNIFSQIFIRRCSSTSARVIEEKKCVLYGDEASPPVRFVQMTASVLGIELDLHKIDLFKSEHKTEFFKKINPLQKVPVLKIGDEAICDSHAIAYFLTQQINEQKLYPKDILRAKVDEMLFFNSGTLFPLDSFIFSEYFAGNWPVHNKMIEEWYTALDYLEYRLNNNIWLSHNQMSLGDLCCAATVSSLQILVPILPQRHNKVVHWLQKLQELPCFDINYRGLDRLQSFVDRKYV